MVVELRKSALMQAWLVIFFDLLLDIASDHCVEHGTQLHVVEHLMRLTTGIKAYHLLWEIGPGLCRAIGIQGWWQPSCSIPSKREFFHETLLASTIWEFGVVSVITNCFARKVPYFTGDCLGWIVPNLLNRIGLGWIAVVSPCASLFLFLIADRRLLLN